VNAASPALLKALRRVQHAARQKTGAGRLLGGSRVVGFGAPDARCVTTYADQHQAVAAAAALLRGDPHYEHLNDAQATAWGLFDAATLHPSDDQVTVFANVHYRDTLDLSCFLPVVHFGVTEEVDLFGYPMLPPTHPRLVDIDWRPHLDADAGSVLVVPASGTDYGRMHERAVQSGRQVLRSLRLALASQMLIPVEQLRFRLGLAYAFDDQAAGWQQRDGIAYGLDLRRSLIDAAVRDSAWAAPPGPTNVGRQVDLAGQWWERSVLAEEPLPAMLYLFFALEALLGSADEPEKAERLAFRQALLGHLVDGGFSHPDETWVLYGKVRSAAVHGEQVEGVDWDLVRSFASTVRSTTECVARLSEREGLTSRGAVIRFLRTHEDGPALLDWLQQHGASHWSSFDPAK
jgi:hypothetical protein